MQTLGGTAQNAFYMNLSKRLAACARGKKDVKPATPMKSLPPRHPPGAPQQEKKGKKRMRQFGNVEIPQSAFLAALKTGE